MNLYSVMSGASAQRTAPGNRFERRKERTRRDILAAAERVLADKGFHETKIADIAEMADVGVGTVYLHFATREALFGAVVEDTVSRLKAFIDAARAGAPTVVDEVRAGVRALCRFADENRAVFRIVFGRGAAYHDIVRRAQALFAADIEETLRRGVREGRFDVPSPALTAQALVGMSTQLVAWWADHEAAPIAEIESIITQLSLRGVCREPGGS
jgi:AcrR family transcriptional regulator